MNDCRIDRIPDLTRHQLQVLRLEAQAGLEALRALPTFKRDSDLALRAVHDRVSTNLTRIEGTIGRILDAQRSLENGRKAVETPEKSPRIEQARRASWRP